MKQQVSTEGAPAVPGILSQAIASNGFIFVAGQVHNTTEGVLVNGFPEEKLAQIMKNISAVLEAAGSTLDDIVKATIFVTDMSFMPNINKAYPTYFKEPFPAREAVCVKELPLGASIEISVIAEKK